MSPETAPHDAADILRHAYADAAGRVLFHRLAAPDGRELGYEQPAVGDRPARLGRKGLNSYPPYRLPDLSAELGRDPSRPVLIFRNEADADRAAALGLPATALLPQWAEDEARVFAGRVVYLVVRDGDDFDAEWGHEKAERLRALGAAAKVASLSAWRPGQSLDEWLDTWPEWAEAAEFLAYLDAAPPLRPAAEPAEAVADPDASGLPTIVCGGEDAPDLPTLAAAAMEALAPGDGEPPVYQRGGALVRVLVRDDGAGPPAAETLGHDAARGILARRARWAIRYVNRRGEAGLRPVAPPKDVVADLLSLGGWDRRQVPHLDLIATAPRLAADGRLIDRPGYHADARLLYRPPAGLDLGPIPDAPSAADVAAARELILGELYGDFPFEDASSRAHTLAGTLEPLARLLIDGPTPLYLFDASTEGSGKTLLASTIGLVVAGYPVPSIPEPEGEGEWRKVVTSALQSGPSHVFFDNINRPLDSGAFASALTQRTWEDRLLGTNRMVRLPVRVTWLATGNNVQLSGELRRRCVLIRLAPECERPSARPAAAFRHPELTRWALDHRAELLRAALVLCRAWVAAGMPPGEATLGSYEAWARVMGGILAVAGVGGFLGNAGRLRDRDDDAARWPALVHAWHRENATLPVGTGQLYGLIERASLSAAFADVLGDGSARSQHIRLGKALARQDGRVWGEWAIRQCDIATNDGCKLYRLEAPHPPSTSALPGALPADFR